MQANPALVPFSVKHVTDQMLDGMNKEELKGLFKQCRASQIETEIYEQLIAATNPNAFFIQPVISQHSLLVHNVQPAQQQPPAPAAPQDSPEKIALKKNFYQLVDQAVANASQAPNFFLQHPDSQKKQVLFKLLASLHEGLDFEEAKQYKLPYFTDASMTLIKNAHAEQQNKKINMEKTDMEKTLRSVYHHVRAGSGMLYPFVHAGKLQNDLIPLLAVMNTVQLETRKGIVSNDIAEDAQHQYSIDDLFPCVREGAEEAIAMRAQEGLETAVTLEDLFRRANAKLSQERSAQSNSVASHGQISLPITQKPDNEQKDGADQVKRARMNEVDESAATSSSGTQNENRKRRAEE